MNKTSTQPSLESGALLRKHYYWHGSSQIRRADDWLILFCFGAFLASDAGANHTISPDSDTAQQALAQWEVWCMAPRQPLTKSGEYKTKRDHIQLVQYRTSEHAVYLMKHLLDFAPKTSMLWYIPAYRVVLAAYNEQPVAILAVCVPRENDIVALDTAPDFHQGILL